MVDSQPSVNRRKRTRTFISVNGLGGVVGQGSTQYNYTFAGPQETISEGHTWPPRPGNKRDIGGNFQTSGMRWRGSLSKVEIPPADPGSRYYSGYAVNPTDLPPMPTFTSDAALNALGTTAIARVEPTRSVGDTATLLGELFREGIPSMLGAQLWKDRTAKAKAAGGEYLNFQFGWAPLVTEVRQLASAVKNAKAILKQYKRDEGRLVRRRYDFPSDTATYGEKKLRVNPSPLNGMGGVGGECDWEMWKTWDQKTWFSGAFTYYISASNDQFNKLDQYITYADKILGLELTPEVLWSLAPWSWAIDWFTNVGDIIHNVSAFNQDDLVMRYGYIMQSKVEGFHCRWSAPELTRGTSTDGWMTTEAYCLKRLKSTPYGFGLNLGSLSNYQWSILAALGMTRGPKML